MAPDTATMRFGSRSVSEPDRDAATPPLAQLVRDLARQLGLRYAFVAECLDAGPTQVGMLAFWTGNGFGENLRFAVAGTPCERVVGGEPCYFPDQVQELFASDAALQALDAVGYYGVPLRDSARRVIGHLAVLDDHPLALTDDDMHLVASTATRAATELEREHASRELRESERRFRTLFESAPIGISINDDRGRFLHVNKAFQSMLGMSEAQLRETGFRGLTFEEDLAESNRVFAELVSGQRQQFEVEKRYRRPDGDVFWATTRCAAVHDEQDNFLYTFAMVEDITARKQALAELQQAHDELERRVAERTAELECANAALVVARDAAEDASRAKSDFLACMSHELRSPLNCILAYPQLFRHDDNLTEGQREGLALIERSGEHLLGLINDILDLARIEAGQMRLRPGDFDLRLVLSDIADIFGARARQKGLEFVVALDPTLPGTINGDEQRLRQLLLNLLDNAVKFTTRGHVSLEARRDRSDPSRVLIAVADTGIGISHDDLERVFEPFRQCHDTTIDGSGLGLAIAARVARLMEANLSVSSTNGGSVFSLELPVVERFAPARPDAPPALQTEAIPVGYVGPQRRVLVVDDRAENRRVIVDMLGPLGFELIEAGSGAEALRTASATIPDLVLLDLLMPELDGFAVCRRLRAEGASRFPIVAMSANVIGTVREEALAAGCDDFLAKPVSMRALHDTVARLLGIEWIERPVATAP